MTQKKSKLVLDSSGWKLHDNTQQTVIQTTEDKIRVVLMTHLPESEKRRFWLVPLGIFLTVVTTLATAQFRSFILSAELWGAAFFLAAIVTGVWLLYTSIQAWRAWRSGNVLEKIVEELKKGRGEDE